MASISFSSIVGHKDVITYLKKSMEEDRVGHAILITGEAGSGKKMMAEAYAAALLCTDPKADHEACGTCLSCRKAADGNHPDLIHVLHEKPNVISVDEIRRQVVGSVGIRPYESKYKVYIIPEAEKMNPQAQNALLKTIEEPSDYVVIILLASGPESLLPTVLSRCVRLSLLPVTDREVCDYLESKLHIPDYEAKILAAYAQGNIGKAVEAATDEAHSERRDKTIGLMKRIHGMNTAAIGEVIRQLKEDKDYIYEILDIMLLWCRDVLYFKAAADIDGLVFSNEVSTIRTQASKSSYEGLMEITEALEKCRVRLRANVNFDIALELMLMVIKENLNA